MSTATQVPSWINKGQPKTAWPEWLAAHAVGRPETNGTFMIDGNLGRLRVHKGSLVFEYKGAAYVCDPAEAQAVLAELRAADAPAPRAGATPSTAAKERAVADRSDDTDDITRAIRATKGDPEPVPPPRKIAVASPTPPATKPPASPVARLQGKALPARGSMPSIEWVQLDRLLVDDTYQRSVDTGPSRALITRIGREWDWRLCVPLMVSRRVGGLYVIDGQHRLFGARLRDDVPQLPCCIL